MALTSTLGNIFLPLAASTDPKVISPSLVVNGRLCLFFSFLLETELGLIDDLEEADDRERLTDVMFFLFLHAAFAKDKLAVSYANSLWTSRSAVGETEFIRFQTLCFVFLERVRPSRA